MKSYIKTLTIAGSDCGGGAGIQADLKTFSALGCYAMSVVTALTAQNTVGVQEILTISPEFITTQLRSIFEDMGADSIKTGMLHSAEVVEVVAHTLKKQKGITVVVDPVMVAKDGSFLLEPSAIVALSTQLFPLATVITPNLIEANTLLNTCIGNSKEMERAAKALTQWGTPAVLLKGGHLRGVQSRDCLYLKTSNEWHWFESAWIDTQNTHGTGCTLSAAITAFLARGFSVIESVAKAKHYISAAIAAGSEYRLGQGQGPVQHFH